MNLAKKYIQSRLRDIIHLSLYFTFRLSGPETITLMCMIAERFPRQLDQTAVHREVMFT